MTNLVDYTVARAHQGDRITEDGSVVHFFNEGDTRTAQPSVVKTLVDLGVLVAPDGEKSDDEPLEDKAEGDSDENKGGGDVPVTKTPAKPAAKKG